MPGKDYNDIMTVHEFAKYLKISEKTVIRMAQKGEIPVIKIASQWRFMKTIIDDWLISKMDSAGNSGISSMIKNDTIPLYLSRLVKTDYILFDIKPGDSQQIFKQLVKPLLDSKLIEDEKKYIDLLIERENIVSTAIGKGIAMPHIRNPFQCPVKLPSVIIGICKEGVDFNSYDKGKTHLFFLICSDSEVVHLKIMAKVALLNKNPTILPKFLKAEK